MRNFKVASSTLVVKEEMATPYIMCFMGGFLLDKLRLFPLLMGIVLGIILKSLLDDAVLYRVRDQLYAAAGRVVPTSTTPHKHMEHANIEKCPLRAGVILQN